MAEYKFDGETYTSERGKAVAKVVDGILTFFPGCAGAHKELLEAWIAKTSPKIEVKKEPESEQDFGFDEPEADEKEYVQTASVLDMPDAILPDFDKKLGSETPDYKAFVKKYNLNKEECAALLRRLEKR